MPSAFSGSDSDADEGSSELSCCDGTASVDLVSSADAEAVVSFSVGTVWVSVADVSASVVVGKSVVFVVGAVALVSKISS